MKILLERNSKPIQDSKVQKNPQKQFVLDPLNLMPILLDWTVWQMKLLKVHYLIYKDCIYGAFIGNVLDRLGRRGGMTAAAGGSNFADTQQDPSRTKIRFQKEESG